MLAEGTDPRLLVNGRVGLMRVVSGIRRKTVERYWLKVILMLVEGDVDVG